MKQRFRARAPAAGIAALFIAVCGAFFSRPADAAVCASQTSAEAELSPRARVAGALGREAVRAELARLGVESRDVAAVLDRMSPEQIERLALRIESVEAGGVTNGWAIVVAVLLVTAVFVLLVRFGGSGSGSGSSS